MTVCLHGKEEKKVSRGASEREREREREKRRAKSAMDSAFRIARGKSLTSIDDVGGVGARRGTPVMRAGGGGALVAVDSFLDPPLNPDTCAALDDVRANIDLLENVTEERMNKLTSKQLIGVVGDLLAMAAQSEHERARRFHEATKVTNLTRESSKLHEKKSIKAKIRKEREWLEQRKRFTGDVARRLMEDEAVVVIQSHARGYIVRARNARAREREREMRRYNEMLPQLEARAETNRRREAAALRIQSRHRRGSLTRAHSHTHTAVCLT